MIRLMNLFEIFSKMTHLRNRNEWVETTGTFTGKTRKDFTYVRYGTKKQDYSSYEIVYNTEDKQTHSWYAFYPLPDPDPSEVEGTTMRLRYKKNRPWIFEQAEELGDDEGL